MFLLYLDKQFGDNQMRLNNICFQSNNSSNDKSKQNKKDHSLLKGMVLTGTTLTGALAGAQIGGTYGAKKIIEIENKFSTLKILDSMRKCFNLNKDNKLEKSKEIPEEIYNNANKALETIDDYILEEKKILVQGGQNTFKNFKTRVNQIFKLQKPLDSLILSDLDIKAIFNKDNYKALYAKQKAKSNDALKVLGKFGTFIVVGAGAGYLIGAGINHLFKQNKPKSDIKLNA